MYAKDYPSIISKLTDARALLTKIDLGTSECHDDVAKINSAITHALDIFAALTHFLRSETLQD